MNYRHLDSDFHKGFVQGIIAASTCCQTDEHILPRRYIAALKSLSSYNNIIILLFDKDGCVDIMDSIFFNQKLLN